MRTTTAVRGLGTLAIALVGALAAAGGLDITPAVQVELDKQKAIIAGWAASPVIVHAVIEQNRKGPIAGMDNAKWKVTRRTDPVVRGFESSAAGQFLREKLDEGHGATIKAFLCGAQGEKVAFAEKTIYYLHAGMAKFDVPFKTGKPWQGQPAFDESMQSYAVQISVPVLAEGKPIGVLVVDVSGVYLEKFAQK